MIFHVFPLSFIAPLLLSFLFVRIQAVPPELIGAWDFTDTQGAPKDCTNNWHNFEYQRMNNEAAVSTVTKDGYLDIKGGNSNLWYRAVNYSGPRFQYYTLVVDLALTDLSPTGGGVVVADSKDDEYGGICWAEAFAKQWNWGSKDDRHTQQLQPVQQESLVNLDIRLMATIRPGINISFYRGELHKNGTLVGGMQSIGSYISTSNVATTYAGKAHVHFGSKRGASNKGLDDMYAKLYRTWLYIGLDTPTSVDMSPCRVKGETHTPSLHRSISETLSSSKPTLSSTVPSTTLTGGTKTKTRNSTVTSSLSWAATHTVTETLSEITTSFTEATETVTAGKTKSRTIIVPKVERIYPPNKNGNNNVLAVYESNIAKGFKSRKSAQFVWLVKSDEVAKAEWNCAQIMAIKSQVFFVEEGGSPLEPSSADSQKKSLIFNQSTGLFNVENTKMKPSYSETGFHRLLPFIVPNENIQCLSYAQFHQQAILSSDGNLVGLPEEFRPTDVNQSVLLQITLHREKSYQIDNGENVTIFLPYAQVLQTSPVLDLSESGSVYQEKIQILADFPRSNIPMSKAAVTAAKTTGSISSLASAISGNPTIAMQGQRIRAILMLATCRDLIEDLKDEGLNFFSHPTGLKFGTDARTAHFAGAALWNVVLVLLFTMLHCLIGATLAFVKDQDSLSALTRVHFPAFLVIVIMPLLQSTVTSITVVLRATTDSTSMVIALCALLCCFGFQLFCFHITRPQSFHAHMVLFQSVHVKRHLFRRFFTGDGEYRDDNSDGFVDRYFLFFDAYQPQILNFLVIENFFTFVLAVIEGMQSGDEQLCEAFAFTTAVFVLLFFLFLVWKRPYFALFNVWFVNILTFLQLLSIIFIAFFLRLRIQWLMHASAWLIMAALYGLSLKALIDMSTMLFDLCHENKQEITPALEKRYHWKIQQDLMKRFGKGGQAKVVNHMDGEDEVELALLQIEEKQLVLPMLANEIEDRRIENSIITHNHQDEKFSSFQKEEDVHVNNPLHRHNKVLEDVKEGDFGGRKKEWNSTPMAFEQHSSHSKFSKKAIVGAEENRVKGKATDDVMSSQKRRKKREVLQDKLGLGLFGTSPAVQRDTADDESEEENEHPRVSRSQTGGQHKYSSMLEEMLKHQEVGVVPRDTPHSFRTSHNERRGDVPPQYPIEKEEKPTTSFDEFRQRFNINNDHQNYYDRRQMVMDDPHQQNPEGVRRYFPQDGVLPLMEPKLKHIKAPPNSNRMPQENAYTVQMMPPALFGDSELL